MKRNQREQAEQRAVIEWFRFKYPNERLIVSANGGSRNLLEAVNLKRSGVQAGVPDLFLPVRKKGSGGLFIELKRTHEQDTRKPKVSKAQQEYLDYLNDNGYWSVVCYGFEKATQMIETYMRLENDS